jgi:integrase
MAKVQTNLLTDIQIRKWIRAGDPVSKSDGGGLTFTLSAAGAAVWVLRFRHGGRRQEVTLGRYPDLSLAAARLMAAKKRLALVEGVNPADEVRKAKAHRDWTVRELICDYRKLVLSTLAASTQCSYGRNLKRIENGMGAMSVQSVGPADIVAQIERVKAGWVELFTLWCALRGIFKHAAGKKLIVANPCAGILLEAIIGKRPEKRKRLMLTDGELALVMNAEMKLANLLAIRILLATGVRISELNNALRSDVHLEEGRWHIPKSKTGVAIDIPLARLCCINQPEGAMPLTPDGVMPRARFEACQVG